MARELSSAVAGRARQRLVPVLVLAAGLAGGPQADARPADETRPIPPGLLADERNTIEVFRRAARSVVFVRNQQRTRDLFTLNVLEIPRGNGSGFVWDAAGHVVTNYHVLRGGNAFSVTVASGETYEATLVGAAARKDLAVLRIDAPQAALRPVTLGSSDGLVVGQKVLAIGNPFGLDRTLTTGVISALGREIPAQDGTVIEDVIQTDASINPGNSGGPLLDSAGRLIGVNTAIFSPSGASAGVGFAVPVDEVARVVPQLIRDGRLRRAGLGVTLLPDSLAERWGVRGLVIRDVLRDGPAAQAGLRGLRLDRAGNVRGYDLIVGIGERDVARYADLVAALDRHRPGDEVTLRFRRDEGEAQSVRVRLIALE